MKAVASIGVGIAVGIKTGMETEGSDFRRWATGISTGIVTATATFAGSLIDTNGFGFAGTVFDNFATATFVGTPAEMVSVTTQQAINAYDAKISRPSYAPGSRAAYISCR